MWKSEDSMQPPVDFVSAERCSGLCPELPACSKCPGHHLSLVHTDKAQDGCHPNPPNNKESKDKGDKPPATPIPLVARE